MVSVDFNADVGESFGIYSLGRDEELLAYVSSANVACGFHAGDPATMRRTVRAALERGVAVGAHPGLPDLVGFGRRSMDLTPGEAYDLTVYQIGALWAFVKAEGGNLRHVKPHGALYNMAATDFRLAEAIARAVYDVDPRLILFALSGSELARAGERMGLRVAHEVFADRTYQSDGTLTPRRSAGALIEDPVLASRQVLRMIREGKVRSVDGTEVPIRADTVCLHGDSPRAAEFAREIRRELELAGVSVRPPGG
ncbi:MAG: 5-oxoprolinase subunit PxpA [Alicyclobacillaceae bacterium]|nr:5-oxoprolinase subunit PxpA [Alicyclobacillaceae bacterium]